MSSPSTSHEDLATLRQELNELRATVSAMRSNGHSPVGHALSSLESLEVTDRRSMLKTVGVIAAGVATVGLLRPTGSNAAGISKDGGAAPNATGGNMIIGGINATTSPNDRTLLENPGTTLSPQILLVSNFAVAGGAFTAPLGSSISVVGHANDMSGTPTNNDLYGVYGEAITVGNGAATGVAGIGTTYGMSATSENIGIVVAGDNSTLCLFSTTNTNPPTVAVNHQVGEVIIDTNYNMWYSVAGGTPASFRKIAGVGTAGAAHILATPVRYVDTRNGTGGFNTPFAANSARSFNFTTLQPGTIPTKARGIFGNISVASPAGNGNLQTNTTNSFPAGSAAVMSYRTGVNLSNHFVSGLDAAGLMFVRANISSTDVIIDIQGYYI